MGGKSRIIRIHCVWVRLDLPVVVTVVVEVVEAPTVDVLVLATDFLMVLVEAGRVVVLVVAAVMMLVLVLTISIKSPQVTAAGYSVGEHTG